MTHLTQERLVQQLLYNPDTGEFFWREKRGRHQAGQKAGSLSEGRLSLRIDGKLQRAHRLAWLYVYGEWPHPGIDHINKDATDNRLCNLRLANKQQNGANRGVQRNNKAGFKGVHKHGLGWRAKITVNDQFVLLGTYPTPQEANLAYLAAAREFFGEYASI